ncbi:MAG: glycogen/starch synthase, partial [Candidatus Lindowbacteria bacterium]|nr:glycogen/starch synthase [Candidatus Lindowbacteria bacterium]
MRILFATSEMVPFSKTGGLADVAGGLSKALRKLGHEVAAIVPYYKITKQKGLPAEDMDLPFAVPMSNREEYGEIFRLVQQDGTVVYFIGKEAYYDRDQLYGTPQGDYPDNAERFIFFSKAIIQACRVLNYRPDVIHCNDWQTGLVPIYLRTMETVDPSFK